MANIVSLQDVVDALDASSESVESYLDVESGEIILVTEDDHYALEDSDSEFVPEWQIEHLKNVRRVLEAEQVFRLPTQIDIHEWSLMEEFSYSVTNNKVRDLLLESIHGKGAFRRFREALEHSDILENWYSFRESKLEQIARDWLELNGITYKK